MAPSFVNKILGKLEGEDSSHGSKSSSTSGNVSNGSYNSSNTTRSATGQDANRTLASSAQDTSRTALGNSSQDTSNSTVESAVQDTSRSQTSSGHGTRSNITSAATDTGNTIGEADEKFETVDYTNVPAVEHERVTRTHHEDVQAIVDRERHQDHYHTTIQPLQDKQVMPEQHQQRTAKVQERAFEHEDTAKTQTRLAAEQEQFQSSRTEVDGGMTTSQAPTQLSEHTHHHLHETIQPVIEREILQNTVTHTTIPIHETHHEAPHFHSATTNPVMSLADFNKQQGVATSGSATSGSAASRAVTSEDTT